MNGIKSDWTAGVLHGTVLGPLLFSLHINDIMSEIESKTRLFADDCLCFPEIKYIKLQKDTYRLGIWPGKRV